MNYTIDLKELDRTSPFREFQLCVTNGDLIGSEEQSNIVVQGILKFKSPVKFITQFDNGEVISSRVLYKGSRFFAFLTPLIGFDVVYESNIQGVVLLEKNKVLFSEYSYLKNKYKCIRSKNNWIIDGVARCTSDDLAGNIKIDTRKDCWIQSLIITSITILRNLDN